MHTPRSWRAILAEIIEHDPKERRRIAQECGIVSLRTLDRWIQGPSNPQNPMIIRNLSRAVPSKAQQEMLEALRSEFPAAFKLEIEPHVGVEKEEAPEIPNEFYSRVLRAYTAIPISLREWTITNLVLRQMVCQLDPDKLGLAVVFARCVSSTGDLLIQEDGEGTAFWQTRQMISQSAMSKESFFATIIAMGRPHFTQAFSSQDASKLPECFLQREKIRGMVIYPILRIGAVAGGLIICSAEQDFFTSIRKRLIEEYGHLFGLAFADRDFVLLTSSAP